MAKYLSPSQSTTSKPTKRVIKRPYGVSVTDLDVVGENIIKEQKKKVQKRAKKRVGDGDDDQALKTKSKKAKTLSKPSGTSSTSDSSPVVQATNDCPSQVSNFHPNNLHFPPSVNLPNPSYQLYHSQPIPHVANQLHDLSASTLPTCGRCCQQFPSLNIGGYCAQCHIPLCWSCVSQELGVYYCNSCRSFNWQQFVKV